MPAKAAATPQPVERDEPPAGPDAEHASALWAAIEQLGTFDLVVGVNTKDVETTIVHVLNVVCTGLQQHFPDQRALVIVCDGSSEDRTVPLARFFPAPARIEKLVVQQLHGPGKGNGVRTILEIADRVQARACAAIDGDLVSVTTTWIDNLLRPVLYGLTDVVVPYYLRDKWDAVITNHLCYPVTAALYGTSVRQPIGGDYSVSRRFAQRVLADHAPPDFGIDLYLTTTAIAEGFRMQEAPLGIKVHASTTGYADPRQTLSRMYVEVVGEQLRSAARYETTWRHTDMHPPVLLSEHAAPYYARLPPSTRINEDVTQEIYMEGTKRHAKLLQTVLPPDLRHVATEPDENGLEATEWARVTYGIIAHHVAHAAKDAAPDPQLLQALGALGMGRFLHYVHETRDMGLDEAGHVVRRQAETFRALKPELIERVDELRRGI